jgi:hypothetical protein
MVFLYGAVDSACFIWPGLGMNATIVRGVVDMWCRIHLFIDRVHCLLRFEESLLAMRETHRTSGIWSRLSL